MRGFYNDFLRMGHALKTIMRHKILLTSIAIILLLFTYLFLRFPLFTTLSSFLQCGHRIPTPRRSILLDASTCYEFRGTSVQNVKMKIFPYISIVKAGFRLYMSPNTHSNVGRTTLSTCIWFFPNVLNNYLYKTSYNQGQRFGFNEN